MNFWWGISEKVTSANPPKLGLSSKKNQKKSRNFCYQIFIFKLPASRHSELSTAGEGAGGAGRARTDDDRMKRRRSLEFSGIPLYAQVSLSQVVVLASSKIYPPRREGR